MKKLVVFGIMMMLLVEAAFRPVQSGDNKFGIGVMVGGSKLQGDIENTNTALTGGLMLRYSPFSFFGFTATSTYGTLTSGLDAFESDIFSLGLSGTIFLAPIKTVRPFMTIGVSGFHYSTTNLDDMEMYRRWRSALKFGFGLELFASRNWAINTWGDYTMTRSDELDGVIQGKNDGVIHGMIGLVRYFNKGRWENDYTTSSQAPGAYRAETEEIATRPSESAAQPRETTVTKSEAFGRGIQFETGTATILESSKAQLEKIYLYLKDNPEETLTLLASDKQLTSDQEVNQLIYTRAVAVKTYLVNLGLNPSRIVID